MDNEGVSSSGADERGSSVESVIFKFSNFTSRYWNNSSSESRFLQATAAPLIGEASRVDLLLPGSGTNAGSTALSRFSSAGGGDLSKPMLWTIAHRCSCSLLISPIVPLRPDVIIRPSLGLWEKMEYL